MIGVHSYFVTNIWMIEESVFVICICKIACICSITLIAGMRVFICIGYRSYITIIKELSGNELASEPLNCFIIVIYDL